MSKEELVERALELPLPERVSLAEKLWQSIGSGSEPAVAADETCEAMATAKRRDLELASGQVQGRTHDEVMQSVRRAIGCD